MPPPSPEPPKPLTRQEVVSAFREMGEALARRRLLGEIAVYGGAAAMLQFDVSFATRDVDDAVIAEGHGAVLEAAREVARRRGWHPGWLSEAVSTYVGPSPSLRSHGVFPSEGRPGLRVYLATPDHLLAMKLRALRPDTRDADDALLLARATGRVSLGDLTAFYRRTFPGEEPDARRAVAIADLAERLARAGEGGDGDAP